MQSYGRDLLWQVNGLGDLNDTSLDGALEVDVADLLAEVGLGADQANEAVLDSEEDVGILLDSGLDLTLGLDDELMTTVDSVLAGSSSANGSGSSIRLGGVRGEVDPLNLDEVLGVVSWAELERRIAGDVEIIVGSKIGGIPVEDVQGGCRGQAGSEARSDGREPHRGDR